MHFLTLGNLDTAEQALLRAMEIDPQSAEAAYNLGLLYIRKGELDQAREYATIAYDNGHPLPGLRNKLVEKGAWLDKTDDPATR